MAKRSRVKARRLIADRVVVNGRVVSRQQAMDLERAARMASGSVEERRQAAAIIERVEAELEAARDVADVASVAVRLQQAPGGADVVVETLEQAAFVRDRHGRVAMHQGEPELKVSVVRRARRVDGLASQRDAGALSLDQFEAGMLYRAAYERAQAPVGSCLQERVGAVGRGSNDAAVLAGLERGLALVRLRLVGAAVGDSRSLAVLEAVAGCGATVRSISGGGRAAVQDAERLGKALDAARPWLVLSEEKLKEAIAKRER